MKQKIEIYYSHGNKYYCDKNGLAHREDGPAIEWADGSKEWYINGLNHRTDGPAAIFSNGAKYWYINGVQLTEEEFRHSTNRTCKLPNYLK